MKDTLAVYGGTETNAHSVDGLAVKVVLDRQDDGVLVHQAFLIVNDDIEVELDLSRSDNQAMVALAVGRKHGYVKFGELVHG